MEKKKKPTGRRPKVANPPAEVILMIRDQPVLVHDIQLKARSSSKDQFSLEIMEISVNGEPVPHGVPMSLTLIYDGVSPAAADPEPCPSASPETSGSSGAV